MPTISLNGQNHTAGARTVADLLQELGLAGRGGLAVEVNEEIVPKSEHAERELRDGDRVEVVTMIAGG